MNVFEGSGSVEICSRFLVVSYFHSLLSMYYNKVLSGHIFAQLKIIVSRYLVVKGDHMTEIWLKRCKKTSTMYHSESYTK